jgi:hypothetical protein
MARVLVSNANRLVVRRGRQINPDPEPDWPDWLVDLWQGWPGQEHGEEGLVRSAARRFARQLHNGLSLASQVRSVDSADCCDALTPRVLFLGVQRT